MRRVRIKSNYYKADSIIGLQTGEFKNSNTVTKFGVYGMGAGIAYSLLRKKSVIFGIMFGSVAGLLTGFVIEKVRS